MSLREGDVGQVLWGMIFFFLSAFVAEIKRKDKKKKKKRFCCGCKIRATIYRIFASLVLKTTTHCYFEFKYFVQKCSKQDFALGCCFGLGYY